jgi:hypothetical protein
MSTTPWPKDAGPVVVGGVGGSGTRVVAQILCELGYYLGPDLNHALDNLWFTLLFRRSRWYRHVAGDKAAIFQGLRIFEAAMRGEPIRSARDKAFVIRSVLETEATSALRQPSLWHGLWPLVRAWKILVTRAEPPLQVRGWGWKEPNSHLYLKQLAEFFPTAKYIHTIRHGLDMAFSENRRQAQLWGWAFGVRAPRSESDVPQATLEYWVKANQQAVEIGQTLGEKRFLLVNFDQLCAAPENGIRKLLSFLEIDVRQIDLARLMRIPTVPKSAGRHRQHDLSKFPPELIEAMAQFGFARDA